MRVPRIATLAALAFSGLFAIARAGGPLGICNSAPLKYSGTGTVNLNYDGGGTLGSRSKAQADAIVAAAAAKWTNVGTATIVIGRGADLPVDVGSGNYATYYGKYSDGLNPVIYDTNGSVIDTCWARARRASSWASRGRPRSARRTAATSRARR
jgi:hypothetical protein